MWSADSKICANHLIIIHFYCAAFKYPFPDVKSWSHFGLPLIGVHNCLCLLWNVAWAYMAWQCIHIVPVMATGVWPFMFATESECIHQAHSSRNQILGHLGQLSRSIQVFFSQILDIYRVDKKTFARGRCYLVADWMSSFLIWFRAIRRPPNHWEGIETEAANGCQRRSLGDICYE